MIRGLPDPSPFHLAGYPTIANCWVPDYSDNTGALDNLLYIFFCPMNDPMSLFNIKNSNLYHSTELHRIEWSVVDSKSPTDDLMAPFSKVIHDTVGTSSPQWIIRWPIFTTVVLCATLWPDAFDQVLQWLIWHGSSMNLLRFNLDLDQTLSFHHRPKWTCLTHPNTF
jgi:hypothetical protein